MTEQQVTALPRGTALPVLVSQQCPSPRVSADTEERCFPGSVRGLTTQGSAGLVCAPSVPHPDQFHRDHTWGIITGLVDIFLTAVGQQIPKGLGSWGYQN